MTATRREHAALAGTSFRDGVLSWGGRKVTELAAEVGTTPFYAYSRAAIDRRAGELREMLPPRTRLYYAVKANPMRRLVEHLAGLVDGFDVASAGEIDLALATGMAPQRLSFAGPGKTDSELSTAVRRGVTVSLESAREMRRLAALAEAAGDAPAVTVRINPPFELARSGMKMGGRPSPFGIDAEAVPDMLREMADLPLRFEGFHVYAGSQALDASTVADALSRTTSLMIELAEFAPAPVRRINVGGGFGIPYFPGQQALDTTVIAEAMALAVGALEQVFDEPEIILELGRYLVGEAGIYVCRVIDLKISRGRRFAVVDGGMHHHLAASGNLGQVIRRNYPIVAIEQNDEKTETSIVGPLCTPLDVLGHDVTIDRLRVGSLVAVLQSGAYGLSSSPVGFLSHPVAEEILI